MQTQVYTFARCYREVLRLNSFKGGPGGTVVACQAYSFLLPGTLAFSVVKGAALQRKQETQHLNKMFSKTVALWSKHEMFKKRSKIEVTALLCGKAVTADKSLLFSFPYGLARRVLKVLVGVTYLVLLQTGKLDKRYLKSQTLLVATYHLWRHFEVFAQAFF